MSKPIFYEGQAVGCLIFGEGSILEIVEGATYPLTVVFKHDQEDYTFDGFYRVDAVRPTLYPIGQYREIIANLPAPQPEAWKPKPGEWCWFWDKCNEKESAVFRKFKHTIDYVYMDERGVNWQNCAPFTGELPPHLKEVQP